MSSSFYTIRILSPDLSNTSLYQVVGPREEGQSPQSNFAYTTKPMAVAQELYRQLELDWATQSLDSHLSDLAKKVDCTSIEIMQEIPLSAKALTIMRCRIAYWIVENCRSLASKFSNSTISPHRPQLIQDLLLCVLEDDGKQFFMWNPHTQTYYISPCGKKYQSQQYEMFWMKVAKTYNPNAIRSKSLKNWIYLLLERQSEVRECLGWDSHSDEWLFMNLTKKQRASLSKGEYTLVEIFNQFYAPYWRNLTPRPPKCPPLSSEALENVCQRILEQWQLQNPDLSTLDNSEQLEQLFTELNRIAQGLRGKVPIISLDRLSDESGFDPPDISEISLEESVQEITLYATLNSYQEILKQKINDVIQQSLREINNKPRYSLFLDQVIPGLRLYYCQGKSLRDIAVHLDFNNKDQTRRILQTNELLCLIRAEVTLNLAHAILEKVQCLDSDSSSAHIDNRDNIYQAVEAFLDEKIFNDAVAEMRQPGSDRPMKSLFSQLMCEYLDSL
jgi:hypothetical protein